MGVTWPFVMVPPLPGPTMNPPPVGDLSVGQTAIFVLGEVELTSLPPPLTNSRLSILLLALAWAVLAAVWAVCASVSAWLALVWAASAWLRAVLAVFWACLAFLNAFFAIALALLADDETGFDGPPSAGTASASASNTLSPKTK